MRPIALLLMVFLPGCLAGSLNERAFSPREGFRLVPEDLGLEAETLVVPVEGALLHCWRFRAAGEGDVVVVFGGNADNKELFLPFARELVDAGYDALLVDWRGFGLSTGEPDLWSLIPDASAVLEQVRVDPRTRRLALFGVSLGSPVALGAASEAADEVDALIIEGLLVPRHAMAEEIGGFATFLAGWALLPSGFDVAEHARELPLPILFVHGAQDGLTELEPSAEVFAASRKAPARRDFWIAEGAGHAPGIAGLYGPEYVAQILRFLDSALRGAPARARVEVDWIDAEERALVELGPEVIERKPVEVVLVREGAEALMVRVFAEPGHALSISFREAGDVIGAFGNVPAGEVREGADGGWERAADYLVQQRACWELEEWVFERLGLGFVLRIGGGRVLMQFGEEPMTPEGQAAACAEVRERLEATAEDGLPIAVRLTRSELWRAVARELVELKDEPRARTAIERSLALLPPDPIATFRFTDSSWQLGIEVDEIAEVLAALAEITDDAERRASDLALAEEWRARALARTDWLADWTARQLAEREGLSTGPLAVRE